MTVAEAVHALDGRAASWGLRRSLAPASAAGISLALGLCAAAWFTAGTRGGDIDGALALCGCYLAGRAASQAATPEAGMPARDAMPARDGAWDGTASVGSLVVVCSVTAQCAVLAGLAVDGDATGWSGTWKLAVTVIIVAAVRRTISACGGATRRRTDDRGVRIRVADAVLTLPAGGGVLLIALVVPSAGPHAALSGLLAWEIAALAGAIAGHRSGRTGVGEPDPGRHATLPVCRAILAACRDDGAFARSAGRLVRGQLVPLPPALAGLAAAAMLAVLGLADLPGIIALTPLVVMLLAAPGCSHPHDGRLDWLVPAVLQSGQYVYIAALGFAARVPGPVIFAVCATIAVRAADLAYRAGNAPPAADMSTGTGTGAGPRAGAGMGWEGRMLAVGLGTILGVATLGYLALTAYLGVLIGRKVLTSYLPAEEGDRR
jgi:hypothetical protein